MFRYLAVFAFVALSFAQDYDYDQPRPAPPRVQKGYSGPSKQAVTPTPILKQINRHNEDGSYTYGYESADGTFKIETKLSTGEVKGKYGYVDDVGKVRVIEYGATKYGFEPSGEGITVAPPTLVDDTTDKQGNILPEFSGSYYDQDEPAQAQAPAQQYSLQQISRPKPRPQLQNLEYSAPQTFEPAQIPQRSAAPVPARAAVPGASLLSSSTFDFPSRPAPARSFSPAPAAVRPAPSPSFRDFDSIPAAAPRPAPRVSYPAPAPARPQVQSFAPAPAPARPQPQAYAPAPRPVSIPQGRAGGILDQLSKDYALPQGGSAPLHDISFGYY